MKLDVVVSRYNEDLDWLNVFRKFECPVTLYVYDKNDVSVSPRFDFAKVIYFQILGDKDTLTLNTFNLIINVLMTNVILSSVKETLMNILTYIGLKID